MSHDFRENILWMSFKNIALRIPPERGKIHDKCEVALIFHNLLQLTTSLVIELRLRFIKRQCRNKVSEILSDLRQTRHYEVITAKQGEYNVRIGEESYL